MPDRRAAQATREAVRRGIAAARRRALAETQRKQLSISSRRPSRPRQRTTPRRRGGNLGSSWPQRAPQRPSTVGNGVVAFGFVCFQRARMCCTCLYTYRQIRRHVHAYDCMHVGEYMYAWLPNLPSPFGKAPLCYERSFLFFSSASSFSSSSSFRRIPIRGGKHRGRDR